MHSHLILFSVLRLVRSNQRNQYRIRIIKRKLALQQIRERSLSLAFQQIAIEHTHDDASCTGQEKMPPNFCKLYEDNFKLFFRSIHLAKVKHHGHVLGRLLRRDL